MNKENWFLRREGTDKEAVEELSRGLSIDPFISKLLLNRGINNVEEGRQFLFGDVNDLLDPYEMKDMRKAVEKMKEAIISEKNIVIYGDYDCDGVISTVILNKGLKRVGAKVKYHIPHREAEGYGMNSKRVEILKSEGTELIITCDNGIAAFEEIDLANELGMEVILTDHHDIQLVDDENGNKTPKVPNAYAVVNPKQEDCNYSFKSLCGAGIALKFIIALYKEFGVGYEEAVKLMEFCAIATVCDVVDLKEENRIIVKKGLEVLNNSTNFGINALKKQCNITDDVSAYHLGFVIGPCINATGRLETANLSVELLMANDAIEAERLAKELYELNERRKELTQESVEEVLEQVRKEGLYNDKVIVVYNPNIHESIAGIVAGRIKEYYNLPTIVLTKGKDMPKGSARSIEGYDMFKELSKCKSILSKFGGHPMAAGLSLEEDNIVKLRELLNEFCELKEEDFVPKVRIDVAQPVNTLSEGLINNISILEPFGKGNATPLLAVKSLNVCNIYEMGKERNHLKLVCKIPNSFKKINAIGFNMMEKFREEYIEIFGEQSLENALATGYCNFNIDLIYKPSINEFRGEKNIQLEIKHFRFK